ncbi:Transcription factor CPC [Spatholobus suberectus]|nr:Transcription factor CPC [Spatholobus suberectus]
MSDSNHAITGNSGREMKHEAPMREFSAQEEDLIARMFRLVGNRWSLIAGRIPERTAKEIEEYWTSKCLSTSDSCSSSSVILSS